jgi:hypothetical protein
MIPPYIDHHDLFDKLYEWLVNFWAISLFFALLPIIAAFAVLVIGAPLWLGYIVWGIAFDIYRIFTAAPAITPELPQQVLQLFWFW